MIGDRDFYRRAMALAVPIMIQNGITNFVNMLDNLMVGSVGPEATTGVAIANQLIFIYNLCIYGAISGVGIFTAQFFGKKDTAGVCYTFRFKMIVSTVFTLLFMLIVLLKGDYLIGLYLTGEGDAASISESARIAFDYVKIMLIGIIPYALSQSFGSTLRETGRPKVPMYAGIMAVAVNLILNYALIFGNLGLPRLGAAGAAIATVISRFVELIYVSLGAFIGGKSKYIASAFKSLYVPGKLVKSMIVKVTPLFLNELLWSTGIAFVNQCYSVRGYDVLEADYIAMTFFNLFSVVFFSVGISIGIIVGQMLGSGNTSDVMDTAVKLRVFSVFTALAVAVVFASLSGVIPLAFNTSEQIRHLSTHLMIITALFMPVDAFAQSSYFTLRSGGKVLLTMVFDSFFVWVVSVPFAYVISRWTSMPILPFYALSLSLNIIKCVLGYYYVKKGSWIKNLVSET